MHLYSRRPGVFALSLLALAASGLLLSGCGEKKEAAATQSAVRVNKDEITVHQINHVLQQQRGVRPEQAEAAGRQILERLIDQQLAVGKADELKLDRDPRVVQQLDAAKREILARAYFERVGETASKPTAEEVKAYFDANPALFKERRVYQIQEFGIEAKPEQIDVLRQKLASAKNPAEFVDFLRGNEYRFNANQAVRAAEQLPMQNLAKLAAMKDGDSQLVPVAQGAQVVFLVRSQAQPVTEEQARPMIEAFLLNDRKRKLVEDDLKAMRAAAKIEYLGKYASPAPAAASAAGADAAQGGASGGVTPAVPAAPAAPAASGLSDADVSKGLGLK